MCFDNNNNNNNYQKKRITNFPITQLNTICLWFNSIEYTSPNEMFSFGHVYLDSSLRFGKKNNNQMSHIRGFLHRIRYQNNWWLISFLFRVKNLYGIKLLPVLWNIYITIYFIVYHHLPKFGNALAQRDHARSQHRKNCTLVHPAYRFFDGIIRFYYNQSQNYEPRIYYFSLSFCSMTFAVGVRWICRQNGHLDGHSYCSHQYNQIECWCSRILDHIIMAILTRLFIIVTFQWYRTQNAAVGCYL